MSGFLGISDDCKGQLQAGYSKCAYKVYKEVAEFLIRTSRDIETSNDLDMRAGLRQFAYAVLGSRSRPYLRVPLGLMGKIFLPVQLVVYWGSSSLLGLFNLCLKALKQLGVNLKNIRQLNVSIWKALLEKLERPISEGLNSYTQQWKSRIRTSGLPDNLQLQRLVDLNLGGFAILPRYSPIRHS